MINADRRKPSHILVLALLLIALVAAMCHPFIATAAHAAAPAGASTAISVDGSSSGRTFGGIGAISGGGGNSRLLTDYPAAQQSNILDFLFKPDYGANLQVLKVEIGGDANSTDGAEPSIEHTSGVINCNAGYEFWLMQQAKARNPNIKLYGLAWAAPGWIGNGNFWSTDTINYLLSWLGCAKEDGLTIDYLGGWNENYYNVPWYIQLRAALNSAGYSAVQIVGADDDNKSNISTDIVSNAALSNAVSIIGTHYPCGYLSAALTCPSNATAISTGKQLWASEGGSQDQTTGAPALIRSITRGYLDAKLTGYLNWPLLAAIYPNMPYATVGLMTANQPWSGNYSIGESLWATAQVTQFTQPGWQFLDTGSGYLGGAETNGSYVTLKSTNNSDYSTIIETTTATVPQTVNVTVSHGLSTGAVHVWSTAVNTPSMSTALLHTQDITPSNGSYSLTVQPGYIYTLTTTTGQGKGTATVSPAKSSLALPYSDSFESDTDGSEAKYLATMQGAFEARACANGRSGECIQQVTPMRPILWPSQADSDPFALLGDTAWSNYTVSADVDLVQAGTVELFGRANTQLRPQSHQNAYLLRASSTGAWSINKSTTAGTITTLANGTVSALGTGTWHRLALTMQGSTISAAIDGTTVGSVTDTSFTTGQVGIGVVGYQTDQFDNLTITPGTGTLSTTLGPVKLGPTGKCLDAAGNSNANGTPVTISDCNGSPEQSWAVGNGSLTFNGKCMESTGQGQTANGVLVELSDCTGGANQIWSLQNSTLINQGSGSCLDDPAGSTTNGTQLEIWGCNGRLSQSWTPTDGPVSSTSSSYWSYTLSNIGSGYYADISGASLTVGAPALQWTPNSANGSPNQRWNFIAMTNGSYEIRNFNSGLCLLDVYGSASVDQIEQAPCYSADPSESWWIAPSTTGAWYTITSALTGHALKAPNTVLGSPLGAEPSDSSSLEGWAISRL